jgi:hypothetical protein
MMFSPFRWKRILLFASVLATGLKMMRGAGNDPKHSFGNRFSPARLAGESFIH